MSGCSGNCSSCGESCSDRKQESLLAQANAKSNVKKVIAVMSGKGGVGKSTVTTMLAVAMQKMGYKAAVLDADITGPSIPKAFGLKEQIVGTDDGMLPAVTKDGIKVMSINLLLPNESDPVLWRGPVVAGAVEGAAVGAAVGAEASVGTVGSGTAVPAATREIKIQIAARVAMTVTALKIHFFKAKIPFTLSGIHYIAFLRNVNRWIRL